MPGSGESDNLDERIAAAFNSGVSSTDVETLIKAAEAASVSANERAEHARARALDPALSSNVVMEARRQMEDAAFRRERLQTAVTRLRERLVELRDQEENCRRRIAYDKAGAVRDRLAKELADLYPGFAEKLSGLLSSLVASNREIDWINTRLPKRAVRLEVAELVAKGTVGRPVLGAVSVTECYLPPWTPHSPHRWPPVK